MADPYKTLGLTPSATEEDIKKAYRRLARELHPDMNAGNRKNEDRFKEMTNAYNFLSDADKRRRYDRGEIDENGSPKFSGFGGGEGFGGASGFGGKGPFPFRAGRRKPQRANPEGFENIFGDGGAFEDFGDFFGFSGGMGQGRRAAPKTNGPNVSYDLEVSFKEAALGAAKEVNLATGKKLSVSIPGGAEDGTVLRLKGQGMTGTGGGLPGDALVRIKIKKDPAFQREGLDILFTLPVTVQEAVQGGKVEVPLLEGSAIVTVPPHSNSGTVLRLKGKGVSGKDKKGDFLVRLQVALPEKDPAFEQFVKSWKPAPFNPRKGTSS